MQEAADAAEAAECDWLFAYKRVEISIHDINTKFVPSVIVAAGPAMAEMGQVGKDRQDILAHILVCEDFFPSKDMFENPPSANSEEALANRYFLAKIQVQTWDTVMLHCICF